MFVCVSMEWIAYWWTVPSNPLYSTLEGKSAMNKVNYWLESMEKNVVDVTVAIQKRLNFMSNLDRLITQNK